LLAVNPAAATAATPRTMSFINWNWPEFLLHKSVAFMPTDGETASMAINHVPIAAHLDSNILQSPTLLLGASRSQMTEMMDRNRISRLPFDVVLCHSDILSTAESNELFLRRMNGGRDFDVIFTTAPITIPLSTKKKAFVWPVATYGLESLTYKNELQRKIETFEMASYRKILRISWIQKK